VLPLLCSQHCINVTLIWGNWTLSVLVAHKHSYHKNSHINNYFVSYGLLPLCHSNINYCYIWCYNNPFFQGLYSIFGLPKGNRFFILGLSVVLLHLFFFCFFTLMLVSEQFILPFSYCFYDFSSGCPFPLTLFLHQLFVGGSNTLVDFTGREMT